MLYKLTAAATGCVALGSLALLTASAPAEPALLQPALPETAIMDKCVETRGLQSCITTFRRLNPTPQIIQVPTPISEQEIAEQQQRDRRWEERCRPTLRLDRLGVPRYVYVARGCEFGMLE